MGIRFLCPNGHNLNVKEFLAGRRGICPHCGERFLIPDQSVPGIRVASASRGRDSKRTGEHSVVDVDLRNPDPAGQSEPSRLIPVVGDETETSSATRTADAAFSIPDQNQWYVRTVSGEQRGPVDTQTVQSWIDAGSVSAECHVWRTGWPEWKRAHTAFRCAAHPAIVSDFEFDPAMLEAPPPQPDLVVEPAFTTSRETSNWMAKLNQPTQWNAKIIVAALVVMLLLLAPALIYVLFFHQG